MPFPFKKKSDEIPAPEPIERPMRKRPMMPMAMGAKPKMVAEKPEVEEEAAPAGDIGSLGEKYGLSPDETKALVKEAMQHFMGMCGGEEEVPEGTEGETEEIPA